MKTFTIRYKTSTGGQATVGIQAESDNRARQIFATLYPGVTILGISSGR